MGSQYTAGAARIGVGIVLLLGLLAAGEDKWLGKVVNWPDTVRLTPSELSKRQGYRTKVSPAEFGDVGRQSTCTVYTVPNILFTAGTFGDYGIDNYNRSVGVTVDGFWGGKAVRWDTLGIAAFSHDVEQMSGTGKLWGLSVLSHGDADNIVFTRGGNVLLSPSALVNLIGYPIAIFKLYACYSRDDMWLPIVSRHGKAFGFYYKFYYKNGPKFNPHEIEQIMPGDKSEFKGGTPRGPYTR